MHMNIKWVLLFTDCIQDCIKRQSYNYYYDFYDQSNDIEKDFDYHHENKESLKRHM